MSSDETTDGLSPLSQTGGQAICGAVDVGGTKMLAQLFGAGMQVLDERRIATPAQDYDAFVDALADLLIWLRETGGATLPLGVALPGSDDPATGQWAAANLPITGRALGRDLAARITPAPCYINDSVAFALSEANGGAGEDARVVVGLILGTGLAAGLCVDGRPLPGAPAMEIGHIGLPLRAAKALDLDQWSCGCGQSGCLERYITGPGLTRLAKTRVGRPFSGESLSAALNAGDPVARRFFADWCDLVAEALTIVQLTTAPDVIVLGGGLSALPGLIPALTRAFAAKGLPGTARADLRLARFGGTSGTRGAGLLALQEARSC